MNDSLIDNEIERWHIQPALPAITWAMSRIFTWVNRVSRDLPAYYWRGPGHRATDDQIDRELVADFSESGREGGMFEALSRISWDCSSYHVQAWEHARWEADMVHVIE